MSRFFIPPETAAPLPMSEIVKLVEGRFVLPPGTLKRERSHAQHISQPRQIAMYLIKQRTNRSFVEIGKHFGGMHHTTVLHAWRHVTRAMTIQPELKQLIADLNGELDGVALRIEQHRIEHREQSQRRDPAPFIMPEAPTSLRMTAADVMRSKAMTRTTTEERFL